MIFASYLDLNAEDIPSGTGTYSDQVLANNPYFYYQFTETSGTSVADSSSNSRTLTLLADLPNASPLYSATVGARSFNATHGYVFVGTAPSNNYSYEIIFSTTGTNLGIIEFNSRFGGNGSSWDKTLNITESGQIEFYWFSGSAKYLVTTNTYNDGLPHHVVVTHGAGDLKIYIDGNLELSSIFNSVSYTSYFLIGYSKNSGENFAGIIDEVAYYNGTVLTAQQVSNRYNALTT